MASFGSPNRASDFAIVGRRTPRGRDLPQRGRHPSVGAHRLEPGRAGLRPRLQHGLRRGAVPAGADRHRRRFQRRAGAVHLAVQGQPLRLRLGPRGRDGVARRARAPAARSRGRAGHRQGACAGAFHGGLARHGGAARGGDRGPSRPRRASRRHHPGGARHRPGRVSPAGRAARRRCPYLGLRRHQRPGPDPVGHPGRPAAPRRHRRRRAPTVAGRSRGSASM